MTDHLKLQSFLATDPRDVGCERAMAILHVYVELVVSGQNPERHHPGIAAHLSACGPCQDDFAGLLAAAREVDALLAELDARGRANERS
jgi:hypothetical protein